MIGAFRRFRHTPLLATPFLRRLRHAIDAMLLLHYCHYDTTLYFRYFIADVVYFLSFQALQDIATPLHYCR